MTIIALNCGSSSIKSAVFDERARHRVLDARVERLGGEGARLQIGGESRPLAANITMDQAIRELLAELQRRSSGREVRAVVHRIVHGGDRFTQLTRLDDGVISSLEELSALAPLHNPPAIEALRVALSAYPNVPHFAAFDTAFHATLPEHARVYALPQDLRDGRHIRRYGFHGISHEHVMQRVALYLGRDARELRLISCHLGNGASATAIGAGVSVETSMGMTPLEGLVMGTRAGDLDPGIVLELMRTHDREALETLLTRKSGLIALTGTNDMRDIEARATQGDKACVSAIAIYTHRVRKYIGAYAATLGGLDVIAFTGGIGEHSALVRERSLERLEFLGVQLDSQANERGLLDRDAAEISAAQSRVRVLIVRADEERAMAEALVGQLGSA